MIEQKPQFSSSRGWLQCAATLLAYMSGCIFPWKIWQEDRGGEKCPEKFFSSFPCKTLTFYAEGQFSNKSCWEYRAGRRFRCGSWVLCLDGPFKLCYTCLIPPCAALQLCHSSVCEWPRTPLILSRILTLWLGLTSPLRTWWVIAALLTGPGDSRGLASKDPARPRPPALTCLTCVLRWPRASGGSRPALWTLLGSGAAWLDALRE